RTGANCRLFLPAPRLHRSLAASHGSRHPPLFFRRELEYVVNQQFTVVFVISLERRWRRTGEDPVIVLPPEQSRGHGRAWTDGLRIQDPALGPVWLQAFFRQQEVGCGGDPVMLRIAGGMAFQARRGRARKQAAR